MTDQAATNWPTGCGPAPHASLGVLDHGRAVGIKKDGKF